MSGRLQEINFKRVSELGIGCTWRSTFYFLDNIQCFSLFQQFQTAARLLELDKSFDTELKSGPCAVGVKPTNK